MNDKNIQEQLMKKWKCTICGYIHTGEEPPEKCPVCGADRSKFVELVEEATEASKTDEKELSQQSGIEIEPEAPSGMVAMITRLMVQHHAHPVSTHIPNGVLPVSIVFIVMAAVFNFAGLAQAAFYNLIFVLLSMPFVLFSGYNEWQQKYNSSMTGLFRTKMICGAVVTTLALLIVIWQTINPGVVLHGSIHRGLFVFLNIVMLGAAGIAGFLGGKLVFKD
jgi:hypothetical protein